MIKTSFTEEGVRIENITYLRASSINFIRPIFCYKPGIDLATDTRNAKYNNTHGLVVTTYNALDEYIFSIVRDNAPVRTTDVYGISVYHVYRLINHSSHFHCSNRTEPIWLLLLGVSDSVAQTFPSHTLKNYTG